MKHKYENNKYRTPYSRLSKAGNGRDRSLQNPNYRYFVLPFALGSLLFVLCGQPASAQPDIYSFPQIDDGSRTPPSQHKKPKAVDPFVKALSKKTDVPEAMLTETLERGFGRLELIRLILISQKSGTLLPEILKLTEKGTRFAKICEPAKLNNRDIKKEAAAILKDVEKNAEAIASLPAGAYGTAGRSGALGKNGTNYYMLNSSDSEKNGEDQEYNP